METTVVHGARGWAWKGDKVAFHLTAEGGHAGAVEFILSNGAVVRPYSLAPWTADACPGEAPALLRVLRGDFFCLPFGDDGPGIPPHGDAANRIWQLESADVHGLTVTLESGVPAAKLTKRIFGRPGECALYQEHVVSGAAGRFNYGYHPVLYFPEGAGSCPVSTAPFRFGSVHPGPFTNPSVGEYSALKAGAEFSDFGAVALAEGGAADLGRYPAREGFEDLVMVTAEDPEFGWTAVTYPDFVWISLKNTRLFPSTLFWMSNGGRHQLPWGGKHRRRMGVEDVCGYFCEGLTTSRKDLLRDRGIATTGVFRAEEARRFPSVHVVAPVAGGAGAVTAVERVDGGVRVRFRSGVELEAAVDWRFLYAD
ncbi:MAG: hypothetical protein JJU00_14600 [Opitutales bacterium]|nr:hypothetical protein [Opitutales bacterium]